jgi:8-oxo-dGTP diphosphatase
MAPGTRPYSYDFPRPSVTVDCVIFGFDAQAGLQILLIRRGAPPQQGMWALPGGLVQVSDRGDQGEDLEAAARRELEEETGAKVSHLEQLYTFGTPGRDPRGRVISVAYIALVRAHDHHVEGRDDAAEAEWFPVATLLAGKRPLAFDHDGIIRTGVARLQAKVRYAPLGFSLLPPTFTLTEPQRSTASTSARTTAPPPTASCARASCPSPTRCFRARTLRRPTPIRSPRVIALARGLSF